MRLVRVAERYPAEDEPVRREGETLPNVGCAGRYRGLRDAEAARREQEVRDVDAAVDRPVLAERLFGRDDREMRGAEQLKIERGLSREGLAVAPGDAAALIELSGTLAAALL